MTKEQIYDAQISPLMQQVFKICLQHNISMVADFAVPSEDDSDLQCTSAIVSDDCNSPPAHYEAIQILYNGRLPPSTIVKNKDGSTYTLISNGE